MGFIFRCSIRHKNWSINDLFISEKSIKIRIHVSIICLALKWQKSDPNFKFSLHKSLIFTHSNSCRAKNDLRHPHAATCSTFEDKKNTIDERSSHFAFIGDKNEFYEQFYVTERPSRGYFWWIFQYWLRHKLNVDFLEWNLNYFGCFNEIVSFF